MLIGILQFELLIRGAESIKDKRRVIKSVKDRLHREHLVSIAEVAHLDNPSVAGMGLAVVSRDGQYLQSVLDTITRKLRSLDDAELGDCFREVLNGDQLPTAEVDENGVPLWSAAEKRDDSQQETAA
ncbi:MAG: DUF503 domain-containing protein [Phycisphaerales bacterium]